MFILYMYVCVCVCVCVCVYIYIQPIIQDDLVKKFRADTGVRQHAERLAQALGRSELTRSLLLLFWVSFDTY